MTLDPAPDETERAGDLCAACGHERGEHLPPCEMGISTGRPCGCRQFKVPEAEHRLREFYLRDPEMAVKDHTNTLTVLSECIRKNAELRAESAHRRDALHHAWAERDRLRVQLAETRTAMDAFHRSATAMRRDRDRLSTGLRGMARRSNENRRSYIESARRTLVARAELKAHRELAEQGWGRPSVRVMEENAQLRTELAEARALHQETWTRSRDRGFELDRLQRDNGRLNRELAEFKAGRAAGANDVCLCRFGSTCDICGPPPKLLDRSAPADRGPLTPHPPPWPVDEP